MDKHEMSMTIEKPGQPTRYRGVCGYESENKKQFRGPKESVDALTCQTCMERIGYRCDGGTGP